MSADSDIAIIGKAMDEERKRRHNNWHRWNMRKLDRHMDHRFTLAKDGECVMFREFGFPKVNFYPSTGRWVCNNKTLGGHFDKFFDWYKKQEGK